MNDTKKLDRMGLLLVMSHLVITLAILGIYAYSMVSGLQDDTLKTILTVIIGYWFGAMGNDAIKEKILHKKTGGDE